MEKKRVIEQVSFEGAIFNDDSHLIKNVCLLSPVSQHGYRYKGEAMARAVSLYDGTQVYISHPTSEELRSGRRDVMKLAGKVTSPRFEAGKIKGDVETLPDVHGRKFYDVAKLMPESVGCSHVADLEITREDGELVVEEIKNVLSVDLVASPATNKSMFESHRTTKRTPTAKKKRKTWKPDPDGAFEILAGENNRLEARANEAFDILKSGGTENINVDGAHEILTGVLD